MFIKWNIKRFPRVPRSSAKRNWSGSGSSSVRRYCVRQKYRYRKNVGSRPVFDAFTVRWIICVPGYSNIYRHVFSIVTQVLDCYTGTYIHSWSQKYSYIFKHFFCIWSLTMLIVIFFSKTIKLFCQELEVYWLAAFLSNTEFFMNDIWLNLRWSNIFGIKCEFIYTRNLLFICYY